MSIQDIWKIIGNNKKWWLTPLLVIILIAVMAVLYLIKYKYKEFLYSLF